MSVLLRKSDLTVGRPLPNDLVDSNGRVLLARGSVIDSQTKIDDLIQRGVSFSEYLTLSPGAATRKKLASKFHADMNPFDVLSVVIDELQSICCADIPSTGFDEQIQILATVIADTCDKSPDAALASLVLAQKASYAIKHEVDVAILVAVIGQKLSISQKERLSMMCAALTMNISMLEYQDWLQIQASRLTEDQLFVIHKHPLEAVTMLAQVKVKDPVWLQTVATHHENPDGSGYPRGTAGSDNLPIGGQIIRIADMYTARISARAFNVQENEKATLADIIMMGRKQALTQELTEQFIKTLGFYPPGSFVKMVSGEMGIVVRRGKTMNQPIVYTLITASGGVLGSPVKRDTSMERFAVTSLVPRGEVDVKLDAPSLWGFLRS